MNISPEELTLIASNIESARDSLAKTQQHYNSALPLADLVDHLGQLAVLVRGGRLVDAYLLHQQLPARLLGRRRHLVDPTASTRVGRLGGLSRSYSKSLSAQLNGTAPKYRRREENWRRSEAERILGFIESALSDGKESPLPRFIDDLRNHNRSAIPVRSEREIAKLLRAGCYPRIRAQLPETWTSGLYSVHRFAGAVRYLRHRISAKYGRTTAVTVEIRRANHTTTTLNLQSASQLWVPEEVFDDPSAVIGFGEMGRHLTTTVELTHAIACAAARGTRNRRLDDRTQLLLES